MVPVRVPTIDYENPFYCPDPLQFHSFDVSDADSGVNPSISPFSRKSATTLAYNHEGTRNNRHADAGTSSPSIYAFVYGRNRVTDHDLSEEHRAITGRKLASISYDSSPCARVPSYSNGGSPARKRARYTSPLRELISSRIPDGEWKELCGIKQQYSPTVLLALPDQDEQIHRVSEEGYEKVPASALESSIENTVTTRTLLLRLEGVFPRIGFREAADSGQHIWPETNAEYRSERHQALVDLLGKRGALNEFVLTALHDAEFHHLDLGPTMRGINELDLPRGDVMRVFSQSGWFKKLKTLSFAGGRFRDDLALAHIRPLCQIETLILENTSIGNEGVFHIVALKHKLRHLDLSGNPSINDDSIPALILLENLQYLSVFGTSILMPGLRRLAVTVKEGERAMDIKIPNRCRDYIDHAMHRQYLLHPEPPLTSDPGIISMLSKTALCRNLEAHAAINSSIVSTGPRKEMEERLREILEVRNLDLIVRGMLVGQDGGR